MGPRSFFLTLLTVVVVLLTVAGGGVVWVLAQSPLTLTDGGVNRNPQATLFVPRQAPAVLSLLVNPDRLESLVKLETPRNQRKQARQALVNLKASLLGPTDLEYDRDLQPWLGEEMTIALTSLDFDRNPSNGNQPGYLLITTAKNGDAARDFLQLFYSRSAISGTSDLVFEQYQGVNLIYRRLKENGTTPLASALVGDRYLLFANDPKVIRDAINNVQVPNLSLAQFKPYQEAIDTLKTPHIGIAYLNLLTLAKSLETDPTEFPPTLTVALKISPGGLAAESALRGLVKNDPTPPPLKAPVAALNYLPNQTILSASGPSLKTFWQQIETGFGEGSPIPQLFAGLLNQLQMTWGLNLPQDLFSWVTGEYALSILPTPSPAAPDWVFVTQRQPETEQGITNLDNLALAKDLSLGNLKLAGQNVTIWSKLSASGNRLDTKVKGVHASLDQYEIIASSLDAMSRTLKAGKNSLLTSATFQKAIAPLPVKNNGYLYIDWSKSQALFEKKLPVLRVLELAGKPLLERINSVTLTSSGSENGVRRATAFFTLRLKG